MEIRAFRKEDAVPAAAIWNEVVREGNAFPQDSELSADEAVSFFSSQSFTAIAEEHGRIVGLYILHPNNVGRCSHIANASYAVTSSERGRHIGEALVADSLRKAVSLGFRILQFNAVVSSNVHARHLYERLGFTPLGTIPGGFRMGTGYEDIVPYYKVL